MPVITQVSHTLLMIAAFLSILSGVRYLNYRTPMARWGGLFLFCLALELFSYSFQSVTISPLAVRLWFSLQVVSFLFLGIFWFLFISEIAELSKKINLGLVFILGSVMALTLAGLMAAWALGQAAAVPAMVPSSFFKLPEIIGPLGFIYIYLFYCLGILSIIILLGLSLKKNMDTPKLVLPMLLGAILLIIMSALDQNGHQLFHTYNILQVGLTSGSFMFFFFTIIWSFGGITPISRESVFEGINDGVILLDFQNKIKDINPVAQKIIGVERKKAVNHKLISIWPVGNRLLMEHLNETMFEKEKDFTIEGQEYTYNLIYSQFIGLNQVPTGSMFVLRNITSRERLEQALNERAQELQKSNAFLAALAEVNVNLHTATDPSRINTLLGNELYKMGLVCFIAQLDPVSSELYISYISNHESVIRQIEKLFGSKVANFHLDKITFSKLYEIIEKKQITFRKFHSADLVDSPGKIPVMLWEQAIHMIGVNEETAAMILPLYTRERTLGMMAVWGKTLQETDIAPFRIFANQVANVMERAFLYEAEIQRSAELARVNNLVLALTQVAAIVGNTTNSRLVLDSLGQAMKNVGLSCSIATFDEARENAHIRYASFSPEILQAVERIIGLKIQNYSVPKKYWPGERVLHEKEPIWLPNRTEVIRKMFPMVPQSLAKQAFQILNFNEDEQLCVIPLIMNEQVIGAMLIWGATLKPSDHLILNVFGSQVAGIIQRISSYETEVQRTDELARSNAMIIALSKVATKLDTTTDLTQVFDTLGKELKKVDVNCMVGTIDETQQMMKIEYLSVSPDIITWAEKLGSFWPKDLTIPRRLWPTDKAVTEKAPYWDPDPIGSASKMFPFMPKQIFLKAFEMAGMDPDDLVCYLPMISEEIVIGILAVWGPSLQEEDIPGLSVFSNQVATAIRNTRLFDRAQKEIIERTQAELRIQEALNEKEVLLKEVHHRVKNNLQVISSLLNLQAAQISDIKTVEVLRESQNRVRSMALIHEKLYQSNDLARIDFAGYLQTLVTSLAQTYRSNSERVTIKVRSDKIELNIDTAIPCGLIVNELVSNSLKYAFPGELTGTIEVSCQRDQDDQYRLIVMDNGQGLPDGLEIKKSTSLGLKLVTSLVRQIEGNLVMNGKPGARFEIVFRES